MVQEYRDVPFIPMDISAVQQEYQRETTSINGMLEESRRLPGCGQLTPLRLQVRIPDAVDHGDGGEHGQHP